MRPMVVGGGRVPVVQGFVEGARVPMAFGPVAPPAEEEREVRDLRSVPIAYMTI